MASHGVPRVQGTASKSEAAKQAEAKEIAKYTTLVDNLNDAAAKGDFSQSTFDATTKILVWNPEYYTMWNRRRRALNVVFDSHKTNDTSVEPVLIAELDFLLPLLIKYPKCYWIWNHRIWILQQASLHCPNEVAERMWNGEFALVSKMLARDGRNFHGWGYRRLVVAEMHKFDRAESTSLTEQEFQYTTKMLRTNLSNFSAWHHRSKLIPKLLDERGADGPARRALFQTELDKVKDALAIDPYDQSLWFYHQYLMTEVVSEQSPFGRLDTSDREEVLRGEIEFFEDILQDSDDCKWIPQRLLELGRQLHELGVDTAFLTSRAKTWLEMLVRLDRLRRHRWEDLSKHII